MKMEARSSSWISTSDDSSWSSYDMDVESMYGAGAEGEAFKWIMPVRESMLDDNFEILPHDDYSSVPEEQHEIPVRSIPSVIQSSNIMGPQQTKEQKPRDMEAEKSSTSLSVGYGGDRNALRKVDKSKLEEHEHNNSN